MPQYVHDYSRLVNQAIIELPGATVAGIEQKLFEVFHELFAETNVWQETMNISIVANSKGPYLVTIAEGGEFVRLMSLVNANGTGQPSIADTVGSITLRDTPSAAATWVAVISKTVGIPVDSVGKPQVPQWVISRFEPVIIAGLLGNMMMQIKKPYTNPNTARYHLQRFRNKLGDIKSAVIHANLQGANTWNYPTGFKMTRTSQRSGSGGTDQSFGVD